MRQQEEDKDEKAKTQEEIQEEASKVDGEKKMLDRYKYKLSCKDGDYDEKDYREQDGWDKGKERCNKAV